MNDAPSEVRFGSSVGDYRFEVIQYRFPAYTSVEGREVLAESRTGVWVGKFYFERSTQAVAGISLILIVMTLSLVIFGRTRKPNLSH